MSREIYKRIAPHIERGKYEAGTAYLETRDMQNLFLLMRRQEALKDVTRLLYNSHLTGNRIRTSGIYNYAVKGYSANSVMREWGDNKVPNSDFASSDISFWWNRTRCTMAHNALGYVEVVSAGTSDFAIGGSNLCNTGDLVRISFKAKSPNSTGIPKIITTHYSNIVFVKRPNYTTNWQQYEMIGVASGATGPLFYPISSDAVVGTQVDIDDVRFEVYQPTDLNQSTAANQPQLDRVALTEPLGLKNQNGGVGFMTHSPISFAANEAWTVECVVNWNTRGASTGISGAYSSSTRVRLQRADGTAVRFGFTNESGSITADSGKTSAVIIGKNSIITFVAKGDGNIYIYVNGVLYETYAIATNAKFDYIISEGSRPFYGTLFHYSIYSKALSDTEILEGASILRSIFPEIPSVQIGTQRWAVRNWDAVTTPQGNTIQEMQAAANVERVLDGGFDDTTKWTKGAGWDVSGGFAIATATTENLSQVRIANVNKWHRVRLTISNYGGGTLDANVGGSVDTPDYNANGSYEFYVYVTTTNNILYLRGRTAFTGRVDNFSVEEVGFSDSTNLYNAIYNQTSGTVEQKTYAALKAAGMWRNVSNSVEVGSVFGKLYNWYAAKLLLMDINYYNAANPSTPFGWRPALRADLTTLATVGGNALKATGTSYWTTANGTDTTGFSAVGSGEIYSGGTNSGIKGNALFIAADEDFSRELKDGDNTFAEGGVTTGGGCIRMIKIPDLRYLVDGSGNRIIDGSGNYVTEG